MSSMNFHPNAKFKNRFSILLFIKLEVSFGPFVKKQPISLFLLFTLKSSIHISTQLLLVELTQTGIYYFFNVL